MGEKSQKTWQFWKTTMQNIIEVKEDEIGQADFVLPADQNDLIIQWEKLKKNKKKYEEDIKQKIQGGEEKYAKNLINNI